ncbi:helix-hairpin-helix domain-containing protein [Streptomyces sparsogenes]|uniref:helix-hairpin-helix domain-containing protein n=1 Tax=Streptomyces sparsogenes TaxID=67365 RepID=UPI0033F7FEDB
MGARSRTVTTRPTSGRRHDRRPPSGTGHHLRRRPPSGRGHLRRRLGARPAAAAYHRHARAAALFPAAPPPPPPEAAPDGAHPPDGDPGRPDTPCAARDAARGAGPTTGPAPERGPERGPVPARTSAEAVDADASDGFGAPDDPDALDGPDAPNSSAAPGDPGPPNDPGTPEGTTRTTVPRRALDAPCREAAVSSREATVPSRALDTPRREATVSGRDPALPRRDPALPRRDRMRLALKERLPLWLQLRCGIEPRTLAALTVALLIAVAFAAYHFWTGRPQTVAAPPPEPPRTAASERPTEPSPGARPAAGAAPTPGAEGSVVVDVSGKVRDPGVHRLRSGSRVADALEAAGGVRPGADLRGLNRARVLTDGEQIVVGAPPAPSAAGGGSAAPAGAGGGTDGGTDGGAGGADPAPAGPISLNSATAEQLDTLPGVGPVLARHILDYRTQRGGFRSVDELREVKGIGERRFADLRPLVRP